MAWSSSAAQKMLVAARGALTGAARGLSTAVAAAAAHRAFAVPRPAGAALTATLPAPATLAAEDELTLAPAAPIASKLREINETLALSYPATTVEGALEAAHKIGYPVLVRAAFTLGGLGSGFAENDAELRDLAVLTRREK